MKTIKVAKRGIEPILEYVPCIPKETMQINIPSGLTIEGRMRLEDIFRQFKNENRTPFLEQQLLIIAKFKDLNLNQLQKLKDLLWTEQI